MSLDTNHCFQATLSRSSTCSTFRPFPSSSSNYRSSRILYIVRLLADHKLVMSARGAQLHL